MAQITTTLLFHRLAINNDESALWELHHYYFQRLYRFVFSFVKMKEPSEEITNDIFIQIWLKRFLLINVINPEVYLFVCAKNRALKFCKQKNKLTKSYEDIQKVVVKLEQNPESILLSAEVVGQINVCIQKLPPKCRLIFQLVKENNYKYRQVAEILGISEKTVENQMAIAFKKLSQAIAMNVYV